MSEQNNPQQIQIKATDEKLAGNYANMMQVSHTKEEFALDFVSMLSQPGQLVARVIVSPAHAKRILAALEENIKGYESQFGAVQAASGDAKPKFGFQTE